MFRKIHSNRDPNSTIYSEIKNEFKIYFECCYQKITQILERKPKTSIGVMVMLMALSIIISFFILSNKKPPEKTGKTVSGNKVNTVSDGFRQILSTAATIKQGLALKHQIDSLANLRKLTTKDSQTLINELDKLHQLNKPYHP